MPGEQTIKEFYNRTGMEESRLDIDVFKLEKLRTQQLIQHFLPPGSRKIADIGGATGVYSFWLQEMGHAVYLLDAAELHIEIARRTATANNTPLASIDFGDARRLPYEDNMFDAVLLMGPLYHLQEKTDRVQALREARRVLKPGGRMLAAAITRYASLFDGFWRGMVDDPAFADILDADLVHGRHENPTGNIQYFTSAFFHTQQELEEECREAGFLSHAVFAVEGFGWLIPDFNERWNDPEKRDRLLRYIQQTATDPVMIGMSAHILITAEK